MKSDASTAEYRKIDELLNKVRLFFVLFNAVKNAVLSSFFAFF